MFSLSDMSHEDDMETKSPLLSNEETGGFDEPMIDGSIQSDHEERDGISPNDTWPNESPKAPEAVSLKSKFTAYVLLLSCLSAIGGFLFGYDTGVVAGAMLQVKSHFSLSTAWVEAIVSVTIGAAALSAILGGFINDWIGRKPVILIASAVFTVGAIVLGVAHSKAELLIGRSILGIGIGNKNQYSCDLLPREVTNANLLTQLTDRVTRSFTTKPVCHIITSCVLLHKYM